MANLTCMQYWATYLRVLQQAVWPGGNLPAHPWPQRTQQQRDDTKQQSLQCLMNLLPGRVLSLHLLRATLSLLRFACLDGSHS